MLRRLRRVFHGKTLPGACIVLLAWYALHLIVRSGIVPGPLETGMVFLRLLGGSLPLHMGVSLLRIFAAVAAAMGIGVPLGLWMGLSGRADAVLAPVAYLLYPIPKVAFLPLFMVVFGLGNGSKIILILSIILFQILLAVRDGVKEIPKELYDSVKSLGLNRRQTYADLLFPAVLPKIFSALRVSVGVGIATLFFSENFAATWGIGYFIMNCWVMVDYPGMFAGILAMSLMGIFLFKAIDWAEKTFCPWLTSSP